MSNYPEQVIPLTDYVGAGGGGGHSVADLLMQSGRAQADSYERQGEIWRQGIGAAAGALTAGLDQYGKQENDKRVQQAIQQATVPPREQAGPMPDGSAMAPKAPDVNQILSTLPPDLRARAQKGIQDFQEYATKSQQAQAEVAKLHQDLIDKQREAQQHAIDAVAVGADHAKTFSDQPDGGLSADTLLFHQANAAGLDTSQFAPFLAGAHQDFAKVQGDPTGMAAFKEHYQAQRQPILDSLTLGASPSVMEKLASKTREVKTLNADNSETTRIVEDKPGQTFTGAPKQDTRSLQEQLADAMAKGDTAKANTIKAAISQSAAAGRDPLTEAKTAAELANLKEKDQPLGVENYIKTTLSGKPYVDLGEFQTPSDRAKAVKEANAKGVMPLTKENADAIAASDAARMNLNTMAASLKGKLPQGPGGRLLGGAENKLSAMFQTDEDLAAFKTWRLSTIQTIQALGVKGRMNKQEIDAAVEGLPTLTDTAAVANKKLADVDAMLDNKEKSMLTRDRSTLAPIPNTPKPTSGPAVGEQRVIQGKLARWDGKGWMAQ